MHQTFIHMPSLRRFLGMLAFWCVPVVYGAATAPLSDFQFRADFYRRDLQTNTIKGKGHAWMKKAGKEIWADELEIDFGAKRASANGSVHLRDGDMDIWCNHLSQNLESDEAVLEEATLVNGQIVFTGAQIRRLTKDSFEIDDGSYSNCNVDLARESSLGKCEFDWKLYGKRFSVTLDSYAHIRDVLIYVKNVPIFYSPYFVAPVKTRRQSGLLFPVFTNGSVGSGFTLPFFWAINPWSDLLVEPTYYSSVGYHLGLKYRYAYSTTNSGYLNTFLIGRRFTGDRNDPSPDDTSRNRSLGVIGEWAVDSRNTFSLGGRSHSQLVVRLVSDPYFTRDHGADFQTNYDVASLRSLASVTVPGDASLLTGRIQHHQSMIVSKDRGVDRGAVTELPQLTASRINRPLFNLFTYEIDSKFSNFYRPGINFDSYAATLNPLETIHLDPDQRYHVGDYIRTGRRLVIEPRLAANVPMPPGFDFQPLITGGTAVYHFDLPDSQVSHREYIQTILPLSMYLSKSFDTNIEGYEKVSHVFQPRVIYGRSLYQTIPDHPYFSATSPQFDVIDQVFPYEYMRFELINRFRRKLKGNVERFFLLQLSEQFNLKTSPLDLRYSKRLGPVELRSEFALWRFTAQVEAALQLEATPASDGSDSVRENEISSGITYKSPNSDMVSLTHHLRIQPDPNLTEKSIYLNFYKALPTFFDLEGGLEYSYKKGALGQYRVGFIFGSKPRSCWGFSVYFGRDPYLNAFSKFLFRMDFGMPQLASGK